MESGHTQRRKGKDPTKIKSAIAVVPSCLTVSPCLRLSGGGTGMSTAVSAAVSTTCTPEERPWFAEIGRADAHSVTGVLRALPEAARADRELLMLSVRKDGYALRVAPRHLRSDRDLAGTAVATDMHILRQAWFPEELKADRDFMLAAVARQGLALEHASVALRGDRELVLAAVAQDGSALQFADATLQADRELALEAIDRTALGSECCVLRYLAESLRGDRDVVLIAIKAAPSWARVAEHPFRFVAGDLLHDHDLALAAVDNNWRVLREQWFPQRAREDRKVLAAALAKNPRLIFEVWFPPLLKADRAFMLEAVSRNGDALMHAAEVLKKDREVVMVALTKYGSALQYVAEPLRSDKEIVNLAVAQDGNALEYAPEALRDDVAIAAAAVARSPRILNTAWFPAKMLAEKEVVRAGFAEMGCSALKHADKGLKANNNFFLDI